MSTLAMVDPLPPRSARLKRALDLVVATLGLAILSPVFMAAAFAVVMEDRFPFFFRQIRVGLRGKPFHLLKFRSMRVSISGTQVTARNDQRLTRVGRVLRKYKIDELPQLWNVLMGDMSLVGPRPEVPAFVNFSDPMWQAVLQVKPGITDLASLLYRNEEDMLAGAIDPESHYLETILPAKLNLNLQYIHASSLWTDLRLLLLTVRYSFFPSGFDPERLKRTLAKEAMLEI